MNLRKYQEENTDILVKLNSDYKNEYFKVAKYLNFDDKRNKRKIITENSILKILFENQELGNPAEFALGVNYKKYSKKIYDDTPQIDKKLNALYFFKEYILIFMLFMLENYVLNIGLSRKLVIFNVKIMNNFLLVIVIAVILYRIFTIKKTTLSVIGYLIILNLPKIVNLEGMWSSLTVNICVYLLILIIVLLLLIIVKLLCKKEEEKLFNNNKGINYIKLISENIQLKRNLNIEYSEISSDIEFYLRLKLNTYVDMQIIMYDILNMLKEGQEREERPVDIIGVNIKEFCDDVIENYKKSNFKDKIIEIIYNSFLGIATFIITALLFSKIFKSTQVDVYMILLYIVPGSILLVLRSILKRKIQPSNRKRIKLLMVGIIFVVYVVMGFIVYKFVGDWSINLKINYFILTITAIIVILLWIISHIYINSKIERIIN
ncbi:DUF1048 domain-containing protein [Miniphocaeibacter massiliensis]|uniref:DUF1048 domain-containing protein n=1 Tax=Miniphocaeibacter massiliensis TaxID=2041841 RepID=UPI000C1BF5E5|nr:DUF1048 domain-containing protein [Miniphocaeibacter massiliensis]